MLPPPPAGIGLRLYPTPVKGCAVLLVFRESRYDVCVILRGTPAFENALTNYLSVRLP